MFIHLHHHSSYSFLDGYNPIERMVARVKELGMTATAITDHNHLGGIPWFQEECEKQGIKPLLGMEGYFTPDMNEASKNLDERRETALESAIDAGAITEEEASKMKKADLNKAIAPYMYDMHQYHILFIAKNQTGWHNLVKIQSEAARRCTYNGRYLCDMDLLVDYHEGIICTTACFPTGSLVLTDNGYKPIEKIKPGEKVLTHKNRFMPVTSTTVKEQTNLVRIHSRYMDTAPVSTSDHKYFIIQKEHIDNYKDYKKDFSYATKKDFLDSKLVRKIARKYPGSWVAADKIKKGDILLFPHFHSEGNDEYVDISHCKETFSTKSRRHIHLKNYNIKITNDFMWLLGMFAAEGNCYSNTKSHVWRVQFTLNKNEKERHEKIIQIIDEIFGVKCSIRNKPNNGVDLTFNSKELFNAFMHFYPSHGCHNKEIPPMVYSSSPIHQLYYVKGAWEGDGYSRPRKVKEYSTTEMVYDTVSKKLALGISRLLYNNHFLPSLKIHSGKTGRDGVFHRTSYYISLYGRSAEVLTNFIFNDNESVIKNHRMLSKEIPYCVDGEHYTGCEVISTESFSKKEKVYCLNVEDDHSFTVDNIAVHNCVGSYPAKMIEKGDYDAAEDYIMAMKEIFGEDFYLEIQPLDISQQHAVNLFYKEMAEKYDIQVVATNDVHYTLKEDFEDHDTLLCIGTGKKKSDTDRMRYSHDFWIKSEEEMYDSFSLQASSMDLGQEYKDFYTKAIENTQAVADKVDANIKLGSDTPLFSNVQVPNGFTPGSYLEYLSWKGLYAYLKAHPECNRRQYEERLRQELDIIVPKGFAPYMLAVHEYINWANANGVPTGPGRGSAAGSLCLFSIGVTKNIDPIKERLLFSRFLTADRRDPPDIDTDFLYAGRDKVIQHLEDYYGSECVAHIGTYSEMGVKSGLKDVCRVLEIPFGESNNITKTIDEVNNAPGIKFKDLDAMKDGDENEQKAWEKFNQLENRYPEVFRLARAFEGTPRNQGVHASGILVTPMPVTDLFPVRYKDGIAVTLYTGPQLEYFGAVNHI